jgi:hypothetical protein
MPEGLNDSEMKAELQALRKRLEKMESELAGFKNSIHPTLRRRFPRKLIVASISLAVLVAAGGLLWGQGAIQALFIDNNGNVAISGKVGIGGSSSPYWPLAIRGSSHVLLFQDLSGAERYAFQLDQGQSKGLTLMERAPDNPRLVIQKETGYVGIGEVDPKAKLDVNGGARVGGDLTLTGKLTSTGAIEAGSLDVNGGLLRVAGNVAATTTEQGAYLGWNALNGGTGETDFINNKGQGPGGFAFMNTPLSGIPRTTLMLITGEGKVGIGMGGQIPRFPLEIGSSIPLGGKEKDGNVATTDEVSIYAKGFVVGRYFRERSDERIKNIEGRSDSAADLRTLLGIEITDFRYKDTAGKNSPPVKKVIGQQVERVFPQAVGTLTDVVPDIQRAAPIRNGWVELATDLKKGDRVKLIADGTEAVYEVLEATKEGFSTAFRPHADKVFVFGREVNDFRTVDYNAIAMLNVSATQQIKREKDAEVKALKGENAKLQAQVDALEAAVGRFAQIETELTEMKRLVASGAEAQQRDGNVVAAGR